MLIRKSDTIAIIVDIQERLFPSIYENEKLLEETILLIKGLTALGVPLICTEQYPKGLGRTVPEIAELLYSFSRVEKTTFSCFGEPEFIELLKVSGRKNIIIAGIEAHICVQQTVLNAISEGYLPYVIRGCVSSRKPHDRETAFERMRKENAVITTCESVLYELCADSRDPAFKSLLTLVK